MPLSGIVNGGSVLDTSALIGWPIERIRGGFVIERQRRELERVAPDKLVILDALDLEWSSPNSDSIEKAREIAVGSGDILGISEVDLHLLALAMELGKSLVTDDYRLQNLCNLAGLDWLAVSTKGIESTWTWEIRCTGCGASVRSAHSDTRALESDLGECRDCGSSLKIARKK